MQCRFFPSLCEHLDTLILVSLITTKAYSLVSIFSMNECVSLHDAQDQHYFDYAFWVKGMGPVIVPGLQSDPDTAPLDHSGISFVRSNTA